MELPTDIRAQREVEDTAIRLGAERSKLETQLSGTIGKAVELMDAADGKGVSVERLAQLIGVNRPTLYRWRKAVEIHRAEHSAAGER